MIIRYLFIPMAFFMIAASFQTRSQANTELIYVGTFTGAGEPGIFVYAFDRENGKLNLIQELQTHESPSFIELHPNGRFLYSVNRGTVIPGKKWGSVSAYAIDPVTGKLTHLNDQPAFGAEPCHISLDSKGRMAFIANYTTGNVAAYPLLDDGRLGTVTDSRQHTGSSVNERRQEGPHAHCVMPSPDDRFLYAVDLGIDRVKAYEIDYRNEKLVPRPASDGVLEPGAGPRHIAFTPDGGYAYVIEELNSGVTAFRVDPGTGGLRFLQHIPTVPTDFEGTNYCADIHVSGDGKFLYGSNRGHDSLVIYAIDGKTGRLERVGFEPTLGEWPRNFLVEPLGEFVFAANQNSDNLVVFRRNPETGTLSATGEEVTIPKPVCVKILIK